MKEKIKNFFAFLKSAWEGGPSGKFGILVFIVSLFFFVRLFVGTQNIPDYIIRITKLNHERKELALLQKDLNQIQHHVYLLQRPSSSSDYIEELGLKTLNLGNPEFHELKY